MDEKREEKRRERLKHWLFEYRSAASIVRGNGVILMVCAPLVAVLFAGRWGTLAGLCVLAFQSYAGYWLFTSPRRYPIPRRLAKFAKKQEQEGR